MGIADAKNVVAADYVGVVSANDDPNKLAKTGWTITKGEVVNAPVIEDLPLVMECKLVSFDPETEICIGDVVRVSADESVLAENGTVDVKKLNPLCYASGVRGYYTIGEKVGNAFSDGLKLK